MFTPLLPLFDANLIKDVARTPGKIKIPLGKVTSPLATQNLVQKPGPNGQIPGFTGLKQRHPSISNGFSRQFSISPAAGLETLSPSSLLLNINKQIQTRGAILHHRIYLLLAKLFVLSLYIISAIS